jgi:hypothetical protein
MFIESTFCIHYLGSASETYVSPETCNQEIRRKLHSLETYRMTNKKLVYLPDSSQ